MDSVSLPHHLRLDLTAFDAGMRAYPLARVIRTQLHHAERVPQGPSILVGNHGPLAIDTGLLVHAMHRDLGRAVRTLGDRMLFSHRLGRMLVKGFGGVEASPDNARQLLAAGECVRALTRGTRGDRVRARARARIRFRGAMREVNGIGANPRAHLNRHRGLGPSVPLGVVRPRRNAVRLRAPPRSEPKSSSSSMPMVRRHMQQSLLMRTGWCPLGARYVDRLSPPRAATRLSGPEVMQKNRPGNISWLRVRV
ncbi:MAG: hypothetical protein RL385_2908 [Pseudomonadota bacterium]